LLKIPLNYSKKLKKLKIPSKKISAYLSLVRLPNLFTLPGDLICGLLLSGAGKIDISFTYLIISSICAYIFGLIGNDIVDIEEDKESNPMRPLASGEISLTHAKIAKTIFFLSSLFFAYFASKTSLSVMIILLLFIITYNNFLKNNSILGPILLASCRALNVILGYSFHSLPFSLSSIMNLITFIFLYFLYIFGLSFAAHKERNSDLFSFSIGVFFSFGATLIFLSSFYKKVFYIFKYTGHLAPSFYSGIIASFVLILLFASFFRKIGDQKKDISFNIGLLIAATILFQSIALSKNASTQESWVILAIFPLAIFASRFFKGS
ncbi:MAG TPA: UbiA family prenyltransferase, partial [Victivallales bacterium]|nr:UbiA family prenyltransferase [Victivallales bacterium]